jgi:predicted neutral ceramidase superfamily lipid hydrolase
MEQPYFFIFFSHWIFAWFILYELKWTSYNPYLWICGAFIINFGILLSMVYYKNDFMNIFIFLLINLIIKGIPILLLSNYRFRWRDIYAGIVIFLVYLIYLYLVDNLCDTDNVYYKLYETIKKNKPIPSIVLLQKWMNHL